MKCIHTQKHCWVLLLTVLWEAILYTSTSFYVPDSQSWVPRLPVIPCYSDNPEVKIRMRNSWWPCELLLLGNTQRYNEQTEALSSMHLTYVPSHCSPVQFYNFVFSTEVHKDPHWKFLYFIWSNWCRKKGPLGHFNFWAVFKET